MSLEIEELKAQIIRRFRNRLKKLGVVNIELITNDLGSRNTPELSRFQRLRQRLSASVLIRICEVALLLSVLPTILPNFRLNYERPANTAVALVKSFADCLPSSTPNTDPFAPFAPVTFEMTVDNHPLPEPIPEDSPDFKLDLRRPCRARTRVTS